MRFNFHKLSGRKSSRGGWAPGLFNWKLETVLLRLGSDRSGMVSSVRASVSTVHIAQALPMASPDNAAFLALATASSLRGIPEWPWVRLVASERDRVRPRRWEGFPCGLT